MIMRQFIAFVKKEFYHIFRDRRTMLILLGMPVVQIILFGFAISTEVKNVRLAVLDPSNDVVTRKIIDRLDASEYFTVTTRFHSPQEMEAAFLKNKVDMAIVFSERFIDDLYTGDARVQLVVDATDPNMSTSQVNYATGIVSMVGQEMMPPNMSAARLTSDIKLLYNPQMKSAYNFVPGVMGLILMLICAMMTSISIVREKETGTMEVLLVSPVKPLFIILAKAVPYFVLSFVNLITILLLSVFVLDVPVVGSLFWLITVSLLFIFVSLALGLLSLDIAGSSSRDSGRDSCKYLSGGFIVRPPECQAKSQAFSAAEQQQNGNGDIAGEEAVSPEISRKKVGNTWKSVVPSVGIGYNKTHKRQKIRAARRDQTAQGERGFRCWTIIRN